MKKQNSSGSAASDAPSSQSLYPKGYFSGRSDLFTLSKLSKEFEASIHTLRTWKENILETFEGGNGVAKKASRLEVATRLVERGLKSNLTHEALKELHRIDEGGFAADSEASTGDEHTEEAEPKQDDGVGKSICVGNQANDEECVGEQVAKDAQGDTQTGPTETATQLRKQVTLDTSAQGGSSMPTQDPSRSSSERITAEKNQRKHRHERKSKQSDRPSGGDPNRGVRRLVDSVKNSWARIPLEQRIVLFRQFKAQMKAEIKL